MGQASEEKISRCLFQSRSYFTGCIGPCYAFCISVWLGLGNRTALGRADASFQLVPQEVPNSQGHLDP